MSRFALLAALLLVYVQTVLTMHPGWKRDVEQCRMRNACETYEMCCDNHRTQQICQAAHQIVKDIVKRNAKNPQGVKERIGFEELHKANISPLIYRFGVPGPLNYVRNKKGDLVPYWASGDHFFEGATSYINALQRTAAHLNGIADPRILSTYSNDQIAHLQAALASFRSSQTTRGRWENNDSGHENALERVSQLVSAIENLLERVRIAQSLNPISMLYMLGLLVAELSQIFG